MTGPRRIATSGLCLCLLLLGCTSQERPEPGLTSGPGEATSSPGGIGPTAGATAVIVPTTPGVVPSVTVAPFTAAPATPAAGSPSVPPASATSQPAPVASPEPVEPMPVPVVLAESGYTTFSGDSGDFATFGIILSNPNSGLRAHQMPLVIDFFDATDAFVGSQELLVTILPGQTTAVGGQVFGAGSARRMEVGLPDDTLAFVPAQGVGGTFELSGLSTRSADGLIVTTGRLTSRFSVTQRSVELTAIYRDGSGRIMGAGSGGVESIDPGRTADFDIVDGTPYAGLGSTDVFWRLSGIGQ